MGVSKLADHQFDELIWSKAKSISCSSILDLPTLVYACLNCGFLCVCFDLSGAVVDLVI